MTDLHFCTDSFIVEEIIVITIRHSYSVAISADLFYRGPLLLIITVNGISRQWFIEVEANDVSPYFFSFKTFIFCTIRQMISIVLKSCSFDDRFPVIDLPVHE